MGGHWRLFKGYNGGWYGARGALRRFVFQQCRRATGKFERWSKQVFNLPARPSSTDHPGENWYGYWNSGGDAVAAWGSGPGGDRATQGGTGGDQRGAVESDRGAGAGDR